MCLRFAFVYIMVLCLTVASFRTKTLKCFIRNICAFIFLATVLCVNIFVFAYFETILIFKHVLLEFMFALQRSFSRLPQALIFTREHSHI